MQRFRERLSQSIVSILKRSLPQIPQIPQILSGLFHISTSLATLINIEIKAYYILFEKNYFMVPKGTLRLLVSSLGIVNECVNLFKQAARSPTFQPQLNYPAYAYAIESSLWTVQIMMSVSINLRHPHSCKDAAAEVIPVIEKGDIGIDAAIETLKFCIDAIQTLPGGLQNPAMGKSAHLAFLHAWESVTFPMAKVCHPHELLASMGQCSTAGISLFVHSFCKTVDEMIQERNNNATGNNASILKSNSSWDWATLRTNLARCLTGTDIFWKALCPVAEFTHLLPNESVFIAAQYMGAPKMMEKMKAATDKLQAHLEMHSRPGRELSNVSNKSATHRAANHQVQNDNAELHSTLLWAQISCYQLLLVDLKNRPVDVRALDALRALSPGIQTMTLLVRYLQASIKKDTKTNTTYLHTSFDEDWRLLENATDGLLGTTFRYLETVVTPPLDGSNASSTQAEINTAVLECVRQLIQLDVSLVELLVEHNPLWSGNDGGLYGPVPGMPLVLANALIELFSLDKVHNLYRNQTENDILSTLDAAIKCQMVFTTLPKASIMSILSLWNGQGSVEVLVDPYIWIEAMTHNIHMMYTDLSKLLGIHYTDSSEVEKSKIAAAALSVLRSYDNFNTIASISELDSHLICLHTVIKDLCYLRSEENSILLPSDVPTLDLLHSQVEAAMHNIALSGDKYITDRFASPLSTHRVFCLPGTVGASTSERMLTCYDEMLQNLTWLRNVAKDCYKKRLVERSIIRARNVALIRPCCNLECNMLSSRIKSGADVGMKRQCGECRAVHYCCSICQEQGWKEHKRVCEILKDVGSKDADEACLFDI